MKSKNKLTPPEEKINLVPIILLLIVITLIFAWQNSTRVYGQFDTVCKTFDYGSCFKFYWQQKSYYQITFYVSIVATLLAVAFHMYRTIKPKRQS